MTYSNLPICFLGVIVLTMVTLEQKFAKKNIEINPILKPSNNDIFKFTNLFFRCHSFDYGDTGAEVCRLSHHSKSTLMQIEEPYLEAVGATTYELGACYNVTVECKVCF